MSWVRPLIVEEEQPRIVYRHDGTPMPSTAREVEVNGVRYESMAAAAKALGCSYSKVYRLIGEGWRVGCKTPDLDAA